MGKKFLLNLSDDKLSIYKVLTIKPKKPLFSNFTFISNLAIYRFLFLNLSSGWIRQNPVILRFFFELFSSKQGCALRKKKIKNKNV